MVGLLSKWYGQAQEKKKKRNALLISELQNLMKKTTFPNIKYNWVRAEAIDYKEAELDFKDEVLRTLKKHNAYTLLNKGIQDSNAFIKQGKEAIEQFHILINEKLESIDLEKLKDKEKPLSKHSCSIPRIREAVFLEVCGEHYDLEVRDLKSKLVVITGEKKAELLIGYLFHGEARIAWGKLEVLCCLKGRVDGLMKNKKLRKNIKTYVTIKEKLDSREPFSEFEGKLDKIIDQLRWNS